MMKKNTLLYSRIQSLRLFLMLTTNLDPVLRGDERILIARGGGGANSELLYNSELWLEGRGVPNF